MPLSAFAIYSGQNKKKVKKGVNKKRENADSSVEVEKNLRQVKRAKITKEVAREEKKKVNGEVRLKKTLKSKKKKKVETDDEVEEDEEIPLLIEPELDSEDEISEFSEKPIALLRWLIHPVGNEVFFEHYWETEPLHIIRNSNYYRKILTTSDIDLMLRENPLYFGRNVDIVKYVDNVRVTENPSSRARASIVWDAYSNGYSIRILNPQTYNTKIHLLLATLQEYFGTMVGANVYLTPAGSQGFAPHYDDIDAFVIQLEGRKHWKLYKSKRPSDELARFSSVDFKQEDLGELMTEVTLNAGDLLYFPRGVVHEAHTDDEMHSLHITVSTYQKTTYADLIEKLLPETLRNASMSDIEFRKGLPIGYLNHLGFANGDLETPVRATVLRKVGELISRLGDYATVDEAADELGRRFVHDSMPPTLDLQEKHVTSHYDGDKLFNGELRDRTEISPDTEIRLIRQYSVRLCHEADETRVYYNTDNARVYHGEEEQYIVIERDIASSVRHLIRSYPNFTSVEDLPEGDLEQKVQLVTELWDYGIIMTRSPLEIVE